MDIAGITVHPDERWMQQIARNVTMEGCGALRDCRYLLHDRDTKYTQSFRAQEGSNAVDLEHVLGEIQTDRGNLHVDGSSCDSSNNDHPTPLRCRGAGAVHHIISCLRARSVACWLISRNVRLRGDHTGRGRACLAREYPRSHTG